MHCRAPLLSMEQFGNTTGRYNPTACNQYKKKLQNNGNSNDKDNNDELFGTKPEDLAPVITKSNDGHYLELVTSLLILTTSFLRVPESYSHLHVYLNGNFLREISS